jgi:hypothetical protein
MLEQVCSGVGSGTDEAHYGRVEFAFAVKYDEVSATDFKNHPFCVWEYPVVSAGVSSFPVQPSMQAVTAGFVVFPVGCRYLGSNI